MELLGQLMSADTHKPFFLNISMSTFGKDFMILNCAILKASPSLIHRLKT